MRTPPRSCQPLSPSHASRRGRRPGGLKALPAGAFGPAGTMSPKGTLIVGLRGKRGSRIEDPARKSSKAERLKSDPHDLIRVIPAKGNCPAGLLYALAQPANAVITSRHNTRCPVLAQPPSSASASSGSPPTRCGFAVPGDGRCHRDWGRPISVWAPPVAGPGSRLR